MKAPRILISTNQGINEFAQIYNTVPLMRLNLASREYVDSTFFFLFFLPDGLSHTYYYNKYSIDHLSGCRSKFYKMMYLVNHLTVYSGAGPGFLKRGFIFISVWGPFAGLISFFLNIPWKWNKLALLRPNYFISIGYLKTGEVWWWVQANPLNPLWIGHCYYRADFILLFTAPW